MDQCSLVPPFCRSSFQCGPWEVPLQSGGGGSHDGISPYKKQEQKNFELAKLEAFSPTHQFSIADYYDYYFCMENFRSCKHQP